MATTIYTMEILGTGDEFAATHTTLDQYPHLPLAGASYLIAGDEARAELLTHHGRGDVAVTVVPAAPADADDVLAPAGVVAAFISHAGSAINLQFRWDEEAHLWCLSSEQDGNYHESDDRSAQDEDDAVRQALADLLIDQQLVRDTYAIGAE